jgi:transglutaminase-like putative cysteine protease
MMYEIYHKTAFKYESLVTFSHNIARLKPKNTPFQRVMNFGMEITPLPYEQSEFDDMFGNHTTHLLIREAHESLSVIGRSRVELDGDAMRLHVNTLRNQSTSYEASLGLLQEFNLFDLSAKPFMFDSELIPKASRGIIEYAKRSFTPHRNLVDAAQEFMNRIFQDFAFVAGFSDITTPIEEIFEAKKGVCQDFAQFAIAALRSIGLPAKYLSGYIETIPAAGMPKLFGADASHAWFALYIPRLGWMEFDPTNNIIPEDQHILLGSGRDYNDVAPLKGVVLSSGQSELSIEVDVRKVF